MKFVSFCISALLAFSANSAPKKLSCEHTEDIATNWSGSKTAPVDVVAIDSTIKARSFVNA